MTPFRKKEMLQAELIGLENLLSMTPDDPFAKSLLKGRADEILAEIRKLEENPPIVPETEIFLAEGPVIGSCGIEASVAGEILKKFQDMVSNHFAARFCGGLLKMGRRRGEAHSRLFLTALPRGSFGLQLSQPHVTDFVVAGQLTQTMEEITDLVGAAAKGDEAFVDTISNFNSRVLVPLSGFLEVLNNSKSDCRIISGSRKTALKRDEVERAYQRVVSAKTEDKVISVPGVFYGLLVHSGRFEFLTRENKVISGWLAEEVAEEQAIKMEQFTGSQCIGQMRLTRISLQTGRQTMTYELLSLKSAEGLLSAPQ